MKKLHAILLVSFCCVFALCLSACGGDDQGDKVAVDPAEYQKIYDEFDAKCADLFVQATAEMQKMYDDGVRRNVLSKEHNYWQNQMIGVKDEANKAIDELAAADSNDVKREWHDKINGDYDQKFKDMREIYIGFVNAIKKGV